MSESPLVLTLIDSGNCYSAGGQGENQICVGYRHQFDLIDERTSETKRFYNVEGKWAHLVAAIDVYEDEEPELLLCFNSKFLNLNNLHFNFQFKLIEIDMQIRAIFKSWTRPTLRANTISTGILCRKV